MIERRVYISRSFRGKARRSCVSRVHKKRSRPGKVSDTWARENNPIGRERACDSRAARSFVWQTSRIAGGYNGLYCDKSAFGVDCGSRRPWSSLAEEKFNLRDLGGRISYGLSGYFFTRARRTAMNIQVACARQVLIRRLLNLLLALSCTALLKCINLINGNKTCWVCGQCCVILNMKSHDAGCIYFICLCVYETPFIALYCRFIWNKVLIIRWCISNIYVYFEVNFCSE